MAISYPLTFPTYTGVNITLRQVSAVAVSQSPFTMRQQVVEHSGQRWEADIDLPAMAKSQAKQWAAWLSSLKAQAGTFTMGDPDGATPRGAGGGTPLVNGADQTGDELVIDGGPTSESSWLLAGDYIQLGSGSTATLHMVLTDTATDGSGNATLDIWPSIRSAPTDNAAVTISSPVGLWRLSGASFDWQFTPGAVYRGLSFSVVEAIL